MWRDSTARSPVQTRAGRAPARSAPRLDRRAEVAVAVEHAHRPARPRAERRGGRRVDRPALVDDHAVLLPGRADRHDPAQDVAPDALERPVEGMAPAAAAGG